MSDTGVRSLDEVARRLVDVAEREDAGRRRVPGWVRDVPRFAVATALAGFLISGLVLLVSGGGGDTDREQAPAAGDLLGPSDYWYQRIDDTTTKKGRSSTTTTETWVSQKGDGRVVKGDKDTRLERFGLVLKDETGVSLDHAELLRLTPDPAALRDYLVRDLAAGPQPRRIIETAALLLKAPLPLPQETRSALLEVLRDEPGLEVLEMSPDRLEVLTDTGQDRAGQIQLEIDAATVMLLVRTRSVKGEERERSVVRHAGVVAAVDERPGSDPSIDPRLLDNLAVFRRAQREAEVPPRSERRYGVDPKELDFDNARRVGTNGAGEPVYVVPGERVICMTDGGCTEIERIVRGESAVGWSGCNPTEVHAVVPDVARNVHINRADGSRVDVKIRDSAVIARVDSFGGPAENGALVWDHPGGRFAIAIHGCP